MELDSILLDAVDGFWEKYGVEDDMTRRMPWIFHLKDLDALYVSLSLYEVNI